MNRPRVAVVGAGLVGLATADALLQARPDVQVVVLDKEAAPAVHQSGRNSGVIHSGVYYQPGSAKARLCVDGRRRLLAFAEAHDIAHDRCGKVVVAVDDAERPALAEIARRGAANGVTARMVDAAGLARLEPAVRGVAALHVADAGIIDFVAVAGALATRVVAAGGEVRTGAAVLDGGERDGQVRLATTAGDVSADLVVGCAGLHSDRVATMVTGRPAPVRIVPFRGEYHALRPQAAQLCRGLIYPVPDPRFPFLGVHLTRHVDGRVLAGPNAVLALRREGYRWRDVSWSDLQQVLGYPGFWRLAARHWRTGAGEVWRSLSTAAFVRALQRMTPDLRPEDLQPYPSGVRAQAVRPDGTLVDDFVVHRSDRSLHVLNAPSPAATACLAIGAHLAGLVADRLA